MSIAVAILGLAFLILIHEAGHFFVARAVGMNPRKFYLGFPPALVKTTRKGIEYGIGSIPLGGYVKIPGMHRPAGRDLDAHVGRALAERPSLVGPVERVRRALEAEDHVAAREALPELEAALAAVTLTPEARRPAERGLEDLRDALSDDAYWRAKTWKRVAVIVAGPGTNLLLALVLFAALYMLGVAQLNGKIHSVNPRTPAAAAGLQPGDRILRIDGAPVEPDEISQTILDSKGKPLRLTVRRAGGVVALPPTAPRKEPDGAYRLGFRLDTTNHSYAFGPAVWQSVKATGTVTKAIGTTLANLVHEKNRKEISSAVGTVHASSEAVKQGWRSYVFVLGLISLSLALLNLLPLLPLDGGHIAFSIVEGIRRRAVAREVYERVSMVGIALVLLLFFIGLSNDVARLGG